MNTQGRSARLSVNRAAGPTELLYDEPFDSAYQVSHPLASVIAPGDTLTTTCSYASSVSYGADVDDELCYFDVLHWPAHALVNESGALVLDSCLY